jgi:hypothetical protein
MVLLQQEGGASEMGSIHIDMEYYLKILLHISVRITGGGKKNSNDHITSIIGTEAILQH